ncbi:J domain-containing protein [Paenibacillus campinasensis]|uniref:Molecular chaperone DnaJ n=1 Tax=Paenibacillus campinasensis TaxID=66347 RepID=A0A268EPB7_9BACL|nr:J domain-containing protein [Paenibacillus campinasensis]PAD74964.1 molecular chaperone DnaJ [Paenibacillus campinasensis]
MDSMKEAYERLNLPENASREELEERYTLLMKQFRSEQRRNPDNAEEIEARFSEITKAYKFILEEERRRSVEEMARQRYAKFKGFAGTAEKIDHFLRYYRFHLLGAIAVIGILVYAIISFINHQEEKQRLASLPPVDLSVMFLGTYMLGDAGTDYTPIEEAILDQFPEWQRVEVTVTYVPPLDSSNPQDAAMLQKALLMLSTERPDMYIMDENAFNWVGHQGMLQNLEPLLQGELKDLTASEQMLSAPIEEGGPEVPVLIDLMSSQLEEQLPLLRNEYYAGISHGAERIEQSVTFIKRYLENPKQP